MSCLRITVVPLILALLLAVPVWAESPSNLAGITLGDAASHYKKRLKLAKARPVSTAPWMRHIPLVADKYFAGGYVLVGECANPGRVIRIKARYRDGSLDFFRKISGEMLTHYGDPTEYKGEIDGRVMGNKWGFSDPWLRPVSLILQRVEGEDPEADPGNTVKLTNWGMLEAERACWQERHGQPASGHGIPRGDHGYLPQ